MADSFTLCGIASLISVGLKQCTAQAGEALLDLWPKAGCSESLAKCREEPAHLVGSRRGQGQPCERTETKGRMHLRASVAHTCFLCQGGSSPIPLDVHEVNMYEDITVSSKKQVRRQLLSLAFVCRRRGWNT